MVAPLPWIDPDTPLPAPELALTDPDGLLAAGQDLSVPRLIEAYRQGIFPWFNPGDPVLWWSPDPRMVLPTHAMHLSTSLRKQLRRIERAQQAGDFSVLVTTDLAFDQVIEACASRGMPTAQSTWITEPMMQVYRQWHALGAVHSVEVWAHGELAGGIYGVCLGQMFFGESMFTRSNNGSKIALAYLVNFLRRHGVQLIDCQMQTAHLASLGAQTMRRDQFLRHVRTAVNAPKFAWSPGSLNLLGEVTPTRPGRIDPDHCPIGYDRAV
jgi:leucyl/phenylalanyl-tRNA--protein transferase